MTKSSTPEYNFFIKPNEIEETVKNKDDKTTEYIIFQNNVLHSKNNELTTQMNEMNNEKNELEDYSDKLEKSKSYLQGISKNQYLLSREKDKEIVYYKSKLEQSYDMTLLSGVFTVPYVLLILSNMIGMKVKYAIMVINITTQANMMYTNYKWKQSLYKTEELKEIEKEIKELDHSSEYLHDLIDNS